MQTKRYWKSKVILKANHELHSSPNWSFRETPWGIYWPSAWFTMMIKDLIQITTLHQKWHFGVKDIHSTCHQLLWNPKMIIFGDPMGYLLTFGIVFDDNQRFDSNHYPASEMHFSVKLFIVFVINCVETPKWSPLETPKGI